MKTSPPLLALLLAACAATPNPDLDAVATVDAPRPQPEPAAALEAGAELEGPAPVARAVGAVGGVDVSVEEFLARLWMRDSSRTREVLEQIVFERLTLLEAERLGLGVSPEEVEEILGEAYAAMSARLEEAGSELSVSEHIRQNLEMDPGFYEGHLRSDAIVQLLAERCVRAWALESERALVDVLELSSEDDLESVRAGLDAGRTFAELAQEHSSDRIPGGVARLSLVRSESHPLARLAFATEPGEVGGPLVQGPGYLLIQVVERLPPEPFEPGESAERLIESLAESPVDNLEFVQWRAAMVRRYTVDLEPFFELVGDPGPE